MLAPPVQECLYMVSVDMGTCQGTLEEVKKVVNGTSG
jgi:hypothetical protein